MPCVKRQRVKKSPDKIIPRKIIVLDKITRRRYAGSKLKPPKKTGSSHYMIHAAICSKTVSLSVVWMYECLLGRGIDYNLTSSSLQRRA